MPDENYLPQVDGEGQGIFLNSVQNKIDVTATQGEAVGVLASNKEGTTKPTTELTIKGATIIAKGEGSASSVGVKAEEDGKLTLTGGVTVDAQGNNATGMDIAKSTVTVTGNTKVTSSGVGVKASTDGSVVVGDAAMLETNSMSSEGSTTIGQDGTLKVTGSKDGNSTLGNVAANGGTVELGSGNFAVNELTGAGKKIALNDLSATVNVTKKTDDMIIVATKKANNQNFVNAQEAAEAALKAVTVGNDTGAEKNQLIVEAGDVNNGLTATIDKNGNLSNVKEIENPTLNAYSSAATLTVFQWRHDMSDLTKRMGELRTSPEGIGSWARVYGSKQTYGAQSLTAKNSSIQVGSDVDVGNDWKVGAAFTYTDGKTTYAQGKADNKGYGIAAYGTWMADNGQFVDLIAKYQRMDNDFEVNSMSGSFDNNAFSLSAEYGWHWNLNNVGFLEPQAELTYGKVIGEEFTTSNDVTIDQEDFESLIGRVGVRGGFYFPNNKGVIYARASVLHDFMGEMESTARQGKSMNTIKDDIGGTWFEWGLGANFKVNDSAYTYVDLERTNGGEVVEDFRWTVGARFVW